MKIYTSYYGNIKNLPKNIIPISISLYPPKDYKGLKCEQLYPTLTIWNNWKKNHDKEEYIKDYMKYLYTLNKNNILDKLNKKSKGKDICLICYELPNDFCHRHYAGLWLDKECKEI